ncbi:MAG: hypothetical protein ACK476_05090 [Fluviicola sp.]
MGFKNPTEESYFIGYNFNVSIFVKLDKDIAYLEYIIIEKYPRNIEYDTLIKESEGKKFSGKKFDLLIQKKSQLISKNNLTRIKLKDNKSYYLQHRNELANSARVYSLKKLYTDTMQNHQSGTNLFQEKYSTFIKEQKINPSVLDHTIFIEKLEQFKTLLK